MAGNVQQLSSDIFIAVLFFLEEFGGKFRRCLCDDDFFVSITPRIGNILRFYEKEFDLNHFQKSKVYIRQL